MTMMATQLNVYRCLLLLLLLYPLAAQVIDKFEDLTPLFVSGEDTNETERDVKSDLEDSNLQAELGASPIGVEDDIFEEVTIPNGLGEGATDETVEEPSAEPVSNPASDEPIVVDVIAAPTGIEDLESPTGIKEAISIETESPEEDGTETDTATKPEETSSIEIIDDTDPNFSDPNEVEDPEDDPNDFDDFEDVQDDIEPEDDFDNSDFDEVEFQEETVLFEIPQETEVLSEEEAAPTSYVELATEDAVMMTNNPDPSTIDPLLSTNAPIDEINFSPSLTSDPVLATSSSIAATSVPAPVTSSATAEASTVQSEASSATAEASAVESETSSATAEASTVKSVASTATAEATTIHLVASNATTIHLVSSNATTATSESTAAANSSGSTVTSTIAATSVPVSSFSTAGPEKSKDALSTIIAAATTTVRSKSTIKQTTIVPTSNPTSKPAATATVTSPTVLQFFTSTPTWVSFVPEYTERALDGASSSSASEQIFTGTFETTTFTIIPTPTAAICSDSLKDCLGNCPGDEGFGAQYDQCGVCNGDGICLAFDGVEPRVAPKDSQITFVGSGFPTDPTKIKVFVNAIELPKSQLNLFNSEFIIWNMTGSELSGSLGSATVEIQKVNQEKQAQELSFYDPSISSVTEFTPIRTNVNSGELTLQMKGLIPYPQFQQICVLIIDDDLYASEATLDKTETTYSCKVPSVSLNGKFYINLLYDVPRFLTPLYSSLDNYNRPQYFADRDPKYIAVFADPPVLQKALFSDTGASIIVPFDRPIQVVDTDKYLQSDGFEMARLPAPIPCSAVFDISKLPIGMFQSKEGDCTVDIRPPTHLNLRFDGRFTSTEIKAITVKDTLALLDNKVATARTVFSHTAIGKSLSVDPPINIPIPQVMVLANQLISSCIDYRLDFSYTSGSAGRPWKEVLITFETTASVDVANITSILAAGAEQVKMGASEFTVPTDALAPGNYDFKFTFTNFLTGSADYVTSVVKLTPEAEADLPNVILSNDHGLRNVQVADYNYLRAVITPGCGKNETGNFLWKQTGGPTASIPQSNLGRSTLVIPPLALVPVTTYTFVCEVGFANFTQYPFTISFTTGKDQIFASAGSSRTIGKLNNFALSATIHDDSYPYPLDYSRFKCTWNCLTSTGDCISDVTGSKMVFTQQCLNQDITGHLPVGNFQFSVTVRNQDTEVQADGDIAYITVVEGQTPIVDILSNRLRPGTNDEQFKLTAEVDVTTVADINNVQYTWTSQPDCFNQDFTTISMVQDETLTTDPTVDSTLKFMAGALTPLGVYCFQVEVQDLSNNLVGTSKIIVDVRDVPSGGTCDLASPSSPTGEELSTIFKFQCRHWTTDILSSPLRYKFLVKVDDGSPDTQGWSLVGLLGHSSTFSNVFPAGKFKIMAVVVDSALSENQTPQIVSIEVTASTNPAPGDSTLVKRATPLSTILTYLSQSLDAFFISQDWQSAIIAAKNAANGLPADTSTDSNAPKVQEEILALVQEVVDSGNWFLDASISAPFAADLFASIVTRNYNLQTTIADTLTSLTDEVIRTVNQNVASACYPGSVAQTYFGILDGILSSYEASSSYSEVFATTVEKTMKEISQCQFLTRACGESPLSYDGTSIKQALGYSLPQPGQTYCQFTLTSPESVCTRYVCSQFSANGILPPTFADTEDIVDYGKSIVALYLEKGDSTAIKTVAISGIINIAQSLVSQYSLGTGNAYEANAAQVTFGSNAIVQSGITTGGLSGNALEFTATFTGNFIALVQEAGSLPTAAPTATTTPSVDPGTGDSGGGGSGAIIGGAAAGAVALLLIAGGVFFMKRKKQKQKENQPSSDQPRGGDAEHVNDNQPHAEENPQVAIPIQDNTSPEEQQPQQQVPEVDPQQQPAEVTPNDDFDNLVPTQGQGDAEVPKGLEEPQQPPIVEQQPLESGDSYQIPDNIPVVPLANRDPETLPKDYIRPMAYDEFMKDREPVVLVPVRSRPPTRIKSPKRLLGEKDDPFQDRPSDTNIGSSGS